MTEWSECHANAIPICVSPHGATHQDRCCHRSCIDYPMTFKGTYYSFKAEDHYVRGATTAGVARVGRHLPQLEVRVWFFRPIAAPTWMILRTICPWLVGSLMGRNVRISAGSQVADRPIADIGFGSIHSVRMIRHATVITAILLTAGCVSEPVAARVESVSHSRGNVTITLDVSDRLFDMLQGRDFFSRASIELVKPSTQVRILADEPISGTATDEKAKRVVARFQCPATPKSSEALTLNGASSYEVVVSWNAHMLIGSRGALRMCLPDKPLCETAGNVG